MSTLHYPSVKDYHLPKKNILVISCMDLRLTDNLVDFLHFDNLHNRYDHFILAGASLLCTKKQKNLFVKGVLKKHAHWEPTLQDHVKLAIGLHQIQDVYIVEHQNCGAYSGFLDDKKVDLRTPEGELKCHKKFAQELADELYSHYHLNVHCFFIDLRGNVQLMYTRSREE